LKAEHEQQSREVETLRSRTNISQQNWLKERDELIQREAFAREEFETAKQAMQDWEVLAMEERSNRENLSEKVLELEDQLSNQREAYERASAERDTQAQAVDGLQRALRDIQDGKWTSLLNLDKILTSLSTQKRTPRPSRNLPIPTRTAQKTTPNRRRDLHRCAILPHNCPHRTRPPPPLRKRSQREKPPNRKTKTRSRHPKRPLNKSPPFLKTEETRGYGG